MIAAEAGSSSYHFARLFLAFTGETPFEFLRRIRLVTALRTLCGRPYESITGIAFSVGYESAAALNKVFKKILNMSPGDFRKLGKEQQRNLIYALTKPRGPTEIALNLTSEFDVVTRPVTHYLHLERNGSFAEVAPGAWNGLFPLLHGQVAESSIVAHLGLSTIDKTKLGEEAMIYQAGVGLERVPQNRPHGSKVQGN